MKTAVSIPDDVFADAEELAKTLKVSRSRLYSRAVREYVARHSTEQVTETLDTLFAEGSKATASEGEARGAQDGFAAAAARHTLRDTEW